MSVAAPARRLWTPRLVATLALFVVSATFFSIIVGYALVSQADDRQSLERRAALLGAIEDIRGSGAEGNEFRHIAAVQRQVQNALCFHDLPDAYTPDLNQTGIGLNFDLLRDLADWEVEIDCPSCPQVEMHFLCGFLKSTLFGGYGVIAGR